MQPLVSYTPANGVTARYFREPYPPRRLYRTHVGRLNPELHPEKPLAEVLRNFALSPPEACRLPAGVKIG